MTVRNVRVERSTRKDMEESREEAVSNSETIEETPEGLRNGSFVGREDTDTINEIDHGQGQEEREEGEGQLIEERPEKTPVKTMNKDKIVNR